MSDGKYKGQNGAQNPETISRSSSITLVSPVVRDGVGEIASKLTEIDDIIDDIDESITDAGNLPDMADLMREISLLSEEVNKTKANQEGRIRALKDEVRDKTKSQILQTIQGQLHTLISEAIVAQVKEEMSDWSKKPGFNKFTQQLRTVVDENQALLGDASIGLENSYARRANSTLDVQDDINQSLKEIKRQDGQASKLFPESLGELFLYGPDQVVQLMREYGLRPLEKHSENLTRFLIFVGVNATIPDQFISFSEEQLPAYGNNTGSEDERSPKDTRRGSSASQDVKQTTKSSSGWPWF